jgi:putative ABC transport system permease protein
VPLLVKVRSFLRNILLARDVESDLDEELRSHLDMLTEENIRAGMPPQEARRAARIEVGGIDRLKEQVHEVQAGNWLHSIASDCRYGVRQLRKNPGFAAVAILTLALGIGANTALFSVVNGVLLNPLPYPHPEELVSIAQKLPPFEQFAISYPDFLDWTRMNRTFQALAAYRQNNFNLTGSGEAQRLKVTQVSASFLPLLGVNPLIGRNFLAEEDRREATHVVMLSASLWKSKFGASPEILGKTLTLDGEGYTVIGVVPESFYFCCESTNFRLGDVYVPIGGWEVPWMQDRGAHPGIFAVGRLKPGATLEQARADTDQIAHNLAGTYPDSDKNVGIVVVPLKQAMVANSRPMLLLLVAAVGLVFLIACVNVANLLLARSTGRVQEFAIRTALGATRKRLVRQLLIESALLAVIGGSIGLLLAAWGTRAALAALPEALPRANEVRLDAHVLLFTLIVSATAALLFGLTPVLKISGATVHKNIKERQRWASGSQHRIQRTFVAAEISLAVVLLSAAGLTIRSLANLWSVNPGFDPRNVLAFNVALPGSTAKEAPGEIRGYLSQLTDAVASIPGVTAAGRTAGALPMAGDNEVGFWIEGQVRPSTTSDMPNALNYFVGPGYLKAMGIRLLRGRFISEQDNIHSRFVAVIDDRFERQYFPNRNPLGEHLHLAGLDELFEIVGVVGHVNQNGLDENDRSASVQLYNSIDQIPDKFIAAMAKSAGFVVRTEASNNGITSAIRQTVGKMNDQQVAYDFAWMEEIISGSLAARRFTMVLLAAFATLALLLATIGVYGVFSYVVGQRTQEIGIRMALGAERKSVVFMVLGEAGKIAMLGVGVGLLASLGFCRLIASMLFRVSSYDPVTLVSVAIVLSTVALVACYIPARRASHVDPMRALRYE